MTENHSFQPNQASRRYNLHAEEVDPQSLQDDCLRLARQLPGLYVRGVSSTVTSRQTHESVEIHWSGDAGQGYSNLTLTCAPYESPPLSGRMPDLYYDAIKSMGEPTVSQTHLNLTIRDARPSPPNSYRHRVVEACLRKLVRVDMSVGAGEWPPGIYTISPPEHEEASFFTAHFDSYSERSRSMPEDVLYSNLEFAAINTYLARIVAPQELQRHRAIYALLAAGRKHRPHAHIGVSNEVELSKRIDPTDATLWDYSLPYKKYDTFGPTPDDPKPEWGRVRDWYAGKLTLEKVGFRDTPWPTVIGARGEDVFKLHI